jgi:hypothetical protein
MFQTSFTVVKNEDERLKDDFFYCSEDKFNSIDTMGFSELSTIFKNEYDWTLKKI